METVKLKAIVKSKGGKILSTVNDKMIVRTRVKFSCKKGHVWQTEARNILRNCWCPSCSGRGGGKKLFIEDMQTLAKKKGGKCLSKKYLGSTVKLKWQCKKGHTWDTKPSVIRMGSWCPVCSGSSPIDSFDRVKAFIKKMGGTCLTKEYNTFKSPITCRCKKGHVWTAQARAFNRGAWCHKCSGYRRTIETMQELAKREKGLCLSKKYEGFRGPLKWQCKEGHNFKATPSYISTYGFCPKCRAIKAGK